MSEFLKPAACVDKPTKQLFKKMEGKEAYNVGVFAVSLKRWREKQYSAKIETLIAKHNGCKLWVGGSQPPLLIALLETEDFISFDSKWNYGDLGWRVGMNVNKLQTQKVLHWNGPQKPWEANGLYKELWKPHADKFKDLFGVALKPSVGLLPKGECGVVLDEQRSQTPCSWGKSYGCAAKGTMYVTGGCRGVFKLDTEDEPFECASVDKGRVECAPSRADCDINLMTTFFTTKKDWQRDKYIKPQYKYMEKFARSVHAVKRVKVTVVHDGLPDEFTRSSSSSQISFRYCDLTRFDSSLGVNDVRYFCFLELLEENTDWESAFITDISDVRVMQNPCDKLKPGKVYVGRELELLKPHPWMEKRYEQMGGKYQRWYKNLKRKVHRTFNCGLTGGLRLDLLWLVRRMTELVVDPDLKVRKKVDAEGDGAEVNVNMAVLNYIIFNELGTDKVISDEPMHSKYKKYETRKDVWFIHK